MSRNTLTIAVVVVGIAVLLSAGTVSFKCESDTIDAPEVLEDAADRIEDAADELTE